MTEHNTLDQLRADLDRLDDGLHDLLMQRAEIVSKLAALRAKGPVVIRPGREAAIIRRLVTRHTGTLPAHTIAHIWRALFAGTTHMQGGLTVAAYGGVIGIDTVRRHLGPDMPIQTYASETAALAADCQIVAMPWPTADHCWWSALRSCPGLHIVARLPFVEGPDPAFALLARSLPDASGQDRSLLMTMTDDLEKRIARLQLTNVTRLVCDNLALLDVAGFVDSNDSALAASRMTYVGAYASPLALA